MRTIGTAFKCSRLYGGNRDSWWSKRIVSGLTNGMRSYEIHLHFFPHMPTFLWSARTSAAAAGRLPNSPVHLGHWAICGNQETSIIKAIDAKTVIAQATFPTWNLTFGIRLHYAIGSGCCWRRSCVPHTTAVSPNDISRVICRVNMNT